MTHDVEGSKTLPFVNIRGRYGFSNITAAAKNYRLTGDPDKFLWWDGRHPTTAFHRVTSEAIYDSLTPPLVLACPIQRGGGILEFRWQGGSAPFRLLQSNDLADGQRQGGEPMVRPS